MNMGDIPALVMAGGAGTRMGASGITTPKPLVPVLGLPLIERNLMQLAGELHQVPFDQRKPQYRDKRLRGCDARCTHPCTGSTSHHQGGYVPHVHAALLLLGRDAL